MEKWVLTSAIALKIEINMRVILSQFKDICKDLMSNILILRFEGRQTEENDCDGEDERIVLKRVVWDQLG